MILKAIVSFLVCLCIPVVAQAQIHKCKNADGGVSYSDQPCNSGLISVPGLIGQAPAGGAPRPEKSSSSTAEPRKSSGAQHPGPVSEPKRPLSQRDKEIVEEFEKKVNRYTSELAQRCKNGDRAACVEQACNSLEQGRGPSSDFITCAKSRGYVSGNYWTLLGQKPSHDNPESDRHLIEAALTPRLPAGKHTSSLHTLRMLCFRKTLSSTEVKAVEYHIDENLYVSKGATGPEFRRTFSPKNHLTDRIVPPVMPEYRTLEETADKTCER